MLSDETGLFVISQSMICWTQKGSVCNSNHPNSGFARWLASPLLYYNLLNDACRELLKLISDRTSQTYN